MHIGWIRQNFRDHLRDRLVKKTRRIWLKLVLICVSRFDVDVYWLFASYFPTGIHTQLLHKKWKSFKS